MGARCEQFYLCIDIMCGLRYVSIVYTYSLMDQTCFGFFFFFRVRGRWETALKDWKDQGGCLFYSTGRCQQLQAPAICDLNICA